MKKVDVHVSSAVGTNVPTGAIVMLDTPPPPSITAEKAEDRLKRQAQLLRSLERADMKMIRDKAKSDLHMRLVAQNAASVGFLIEEGDLRRASSRLPEGGACIEADLYPYGRRVGLDTRDMLYSEACWDNGYGTCWLVGPRHVVTARHVFRDVYARQALSEGNLRVVFGHEFTDNNRPCDVFCRGVHLFAVTPIAALPASTGEDWILLELTSDAEVGGLRQPLAISRDALAAGTPVYSLGHPKAVTLRYAYTAVELEIDDVHFSAHVDAYDGSSGSPVFSAATHRVIGMVIRSKQSGGRVEVEGSGRWISLMSFPEYVDEATLCCSSVAFDTAISQLSPP